MFKNKTNQKQQPASARRLWCERFSLFLYLELINDRAYEQCPGYRRKQADQEDRGCWVSEGGLPSLHLNPIVHISTLVLDVQEQNQPEATPLTGSDRSTKEKVSDTD